MFKRKQTTELLQVRTRLTQEVFAAFEAQLGVNAYISKETTELQAGYYLGIKHVLDALRKGIVIETPTGQ